MQTDLESSHSRLIMKVGVGKIRLILLSTLSQHHDHYNQAWQVQILWSSDVWQRSAFPLTNYDCRTQPPSVDPVDPLNRPKFSLFSYILYFLSSEPPLLSSKHNCSFWHFAAFDNRSEPVQCCLTLVQRTPPQSEGSGWWFCPKSCPAEYEANIINNKRQYPAPWNPW